GSILLQRSINQLGTQIITAHTAARRILEMLMMPISTIATANATFASQNYGAGRTDRIGTALHKVLGIELAWSLFSLAVSVFGGTFLIRMLTGTVDPVVTQNAQMFLNIDFAFFFPLSILLVLRTTLQSLGRKVVPVVSSVIELSMKVVACLWLIPTWGYLGMAMTEPISWVLCAAMLGVMYVRSKHDLSTLNQQTLQEA
ncbi:MAG: MATE family efflux transporter, partial [Eubacteriales bacterium]|nr:MATE family efflux transporter [Eubacteriales bacterium]